MNNTDLHIHSKYSSDGEYSPEQLVKMCAEKGIRTMAIADHNCVKANYEAVSATEKYNIRYIPAIEIDCTYAGIDFHVLGYNIKFQSPDFENIENNIRSQCADISQKQLKLIQQLGLNIKEDSLNAITRGSYWPEYWTGEVFAEALLESGEFKDSEILFPYRKGASRSDNPYVNFYWDYFSQGKPCYVPMHYPTMPEIIEIIHANNGEAVLAHPGNNLKGRFELIDELISLGLDGIEAYSSYHWPDTVAWFAEKAKKNNLVVTNGSDFHGKTKPSIELGCCSKIE